MQNVLLQPDSGMGARGRSKVKIGIESKQQAKSSGLVEKLLSSEVRVKTKTTNSIEKENKGSCCLD